jgi:mRNA interferase RelE/StbE
MIYRRTERFKRAFRDLPRSIQVKVIKAFELFARDPKHPSLGIKKIKGHQDIWEGRIDRQYRFTFHYERNAEGRAVCVFRNVDNHEECLKNP